MPVFVRKGRYRHDMRHASARRHRPPPLYAGRRGAYVSAHAGYKDRKWARALAPAAKAASSSSATTPTARLALTVNGERLDAGDRTLFELLADLGYGGSRVATAVNGDFVPERLRAERRLSSGDAIEIVAPRQGG